MATSRREQIKIKSAEMILDQNALDLANRFRMVLRRMARADDFLRSLYISGMQSGVLIITADLGEG